MELLRFRPLRFPTRPGTRSPLGKQSEAFALDGGGRVRPHHSFFPEEKCMKRSVVVVTLLVMFLAAFLWTPGPVPAAADRAGAVALAVIPLQSGPLRVLPPRAVPQPRRPHFSSPLSAPGGWADSWVGLAASSWAGCSAACSSEEWGAASSAGSA